MLDLYVNIRNRRKELGMSQEELAKKVGYTSRSTIARIENGEIDISRSKILAFADALNTTPSALMGWTEEQDESDHIIDYLGDPDLKIVIEKAYQDPLFKERLLRIAAILEDDK